MATWNIINCNYVDRVSGVEDKEKIIASVDWKCTANNGGVVEGSTSIPTTDLSEFTSWESITEAMVVGWLKSVLGSEVEQIEQQAFEKNKQKGLPWAS